MAFHVRTNINLCLRFHKWRTIISIFQKKIKMEISDCIWDEGFLCCDDLDVLEPSLVSSSIPSPGLVPFQWSEAPLADEADNSDMTPQCMPVIDPIFVRENFIEDCLIGMLKCASPNFLKTILFICRWSI